MAQTRQTSIAISGPAYAALKSLAAHWEQPRDAVVRQLLEFFVSQHRAVDEELRHTHISTVLSYPACLPQRPLGDKPDKRRLAFRAPRELLDETAALAYRAPAHAHRQGHRDYASRPLTDAVLTALAHEQPFTDDGLEGLPHLLQWREADGLWRLTIAATLRSEERRARAEGPRAVREMLEEGSAAWHSPWRAAVALHLAKLFFTGPDAEYNLQWIGQQGTTFRDWAANISDHHLRFGDHEFTEDAPKPMSNHEGRSATAVWRAERALALGRVADWIATGVPSARSFRPDPPGWGLEQPPDWGRRRVHPYRLSEHHQELVDQGAVLLITSGRDAALWPATPSGDPIPGFRHIVAGARLRRLTPAETAEAVLVTMNSQNDDVEPARFPSFHVNEAYDLGLIDETQRADITRDADETTRHHIKQTIQRAKHGAFWRADPDDVRLLEAAAHNPEEFAKVARRFRVRFWVARPIWTWEVESIPALLATPDVTPGQLTAFCREWCRGIKRTLEREMELAWRMANWDAMERDEGHDWLDV